MKPPPFTYHAPRSVAEAVEILATKENVKLLAGGQSLMAMLNMRYLLPDHVVDLNRVEGLAYIRDEGDEIAFGSMTRQRDIEFSDLVRDRLPVMREAILQVGHRQTRNRGTIGGSLCHLDPAAELPTVAMALEARLRIESRQGTREVAMAEFPLGFMMPALEPDELVTEIRVRPWPRGHGHAFVEFARRHGDFALASVAVLLDADPAGVIRRAAVAVGGASAVPQRIGEAERLLAGRPGGDALFDEAATACAALSAVGDTHAPPWYRQRLAAVLARRALLQAWQRARGGAP